MRKKFVLFFVVAGLAAVYLQATPAHAGNSVSLSDDWQIRPQAYTSAVAGQVPPVPVVPIRPEDVGKSPSQLPNHCDTIDPYLTTNRSLVSYSCAPQAHIMGASITSDDIHKLLSASWNLDGALPHVGDLFNTTDPNAVQGWLFDIRFRTNWFDARRNVGSTVDCARYAHAGPYLAGDKNLSTGATVGGNNEWMSVWVEVLADDGVAYRAEYGWSHYGPASLGDYLTVARPADSVATRCNGGVAETFNFPGTGANTSGATIVKTDNCAAAPVGCSVMETSPHDGDVFSSDHRTLHVNVPMNFEYVDNQHHAYSVPIIAPGAKMWDISATATNLVNCASTPDISTGATGQIVGPQGIQCGFQLDWIPWKSYDLGAYENQSSGAQSIPEALYGPTCPYFEVSEYTPGQARVDKPSGYINLGNSGGKDNEIEGNALYPDRSLNLPATPLSNYDAGNYAPDSASHQPTQSISPQGRNGATICDVAIPDAGRETSNFPGSRSMTV